jgi:hypothetical protein
MLRCFPTLQIATACFSCSPPDLKFLRSLVHIYVHALKPLPLGDSLKLLLFIIIIIIIILGISFMQGIYTYIPETKHVSMEHCVATILLLLFMVRILLVSLLTPLLLLLLLLLLLYVCLLLVSNTRFSHILVSV